MKCSHVKGRKYGGKLCYGELNNITDAYEWSFVAVPAQKNAGVIKNFRKGEDGMTLNDVVEKMGNENLRDELDELKSYAQMGRSYLEQLRNEVVRLGVMSDSGFKKDFLRSTAEKMNEKELLSFKKAFESKIDSFFPPVTQLGGFKEKVDKEADSQFLI